MSRVSESPLSVALRDLNRGPIRRRLRVEDPAEHFGELPAPLSPVDVEVEVSGTAAAGVRARGRVELTARLTCRKCLEESEEPVEGTLDVWFRPPSEVTPGEEGVRPLEPESGELDLTEVVREEIWIQVPDYWECAEDCAGLCPGCGARLAEESCTCPPPEPDERWAALREIAEDTTAGGSDRG